MDDTIIAGQPFPYKSLPLRITYRELDYQVYLLQKKMDRETTEFRILLDGMVLTLTGEGSSWRFSGTDADSEFAQAIWHVISLRFRL